MAKNSYRVQTNNLTYHEGEKSVLIEVGTADWFSWLEKVNSFSYVSESGNFTARKELLGSSHKNWYWKAYRKVQGKLHRVHLGKDSDLTTENLSRIAQELARKAQSALNQNDKPLHQTGFKGLANLETLITTKLHIPQSRHSLTRSRLLDSLKKIKNAKLSLVSAPPGFGKTTLIADWLLGQKGIRAAWFSIDETDNDPVRFWRYFTQALAGLPLKPSNGQKNWLALPANLPLEHTLAHIINQIATVSEDIYLVLDDYHLITSEAIHRNLAYFLDRVSNHCHLIIISRTDPPLPLARLRSRNEFVEIKAADLRFTAEEISHYLASVMNLQLSPDKIATLENRTEGWIAALQMLVLSVQGRKDLDKFITSFSGSHHYLLDYLTAEVLARQTKGVQDFLLKSSVLERLTDDLVEEVTGCTEGQRLLETLEQSNLFLIRLDEERDWFRYHHLFKEYLYKRLQQYHPDLMPQLHSKAADWYSRHNSLKEAIYHYLKAQQFEQASKLIQQNAQSILMQGEIFTLEKWLNVIPEEIFRQQPDLFLIKAWVFAANGQSEAAENLLKSSLIDTSNRETTAIKTMLAILHLDISKVFEIAGQNLEYLPENTIFLRDFKLMIVAVAADLKGEIEEATQAYTRALNSSRKNGNVLIGMIALGQLGDLLLQQGQLKKAVTIYQEVMAYTRPILTNPPNLWTAATYLGMYEALYEWNKLDEAGYHAQEGIEVAARYENNLFLIFGKVLLARYYLVSGLFDKALETIETLSLDKMYDNTIIASFADLYHLQILIACDRREQVQKWLVEHDAGKNSLLNLTSNVPVIHELHDVILGQALIYFNRVDEAIEVLSRRIEASLQIKRMIWAVRALILKAIAFYRKQIINQALDSLEQALKLAEPEELIRSFVDADPCIAVLLEQLKPRPLTKSLQNYINQLLKVFNQTTPEPNSPAVYNGEPLTERELEVINWLANGLTNKELADKLVISVGTVTWHLKNLYAKLAVRNRTEAILRAKELNLINP